MTSHTPSRRAVLSGSAAALTGLAAAGPLRAESAANGTFTYEVQRTEAEWREMLTDFEYFIMREVGTEPRRTSDIWEDNPEGVYNCRGCDLTIYESRFKTPLDIGWVFFTQSCPTTVMMDIDGVPDEYGGSSMAEDEPEGIIEVHCRRCGSHLGHLLTVRGTTRHCINGTSLVFEPASA